MTPEFLRNLHGFQADSVAGNRGIVLSDRPNRRFYHDLNASHGVSPNSRHADC